MHQWKSLITARLLLFVTVSSAAAQMFDRQLSHTQIRHLPPDYTLFISYLDSLYALLRLYMCGKKTKESHAVRISLSHGDIGRHVLTQMTRVDDNTCCSAACVIRYFIWFLTTHAGDDSWSHKIRWIKWANNGKRSSPSRFLCVCVCVWVCLCV